MKNLIRMLPVCFLFISLSFYSCTKTNTSQNPVQPVSPEKPLSTTPLPGTVDKTDTLRVMAYNVLNYGDGCQASTSVLNGYLKTIVQFTKPDILSCEKMQAYLTGATDSTNLAKNITDNALNVAFSGRYAYVTPTNATNDKKLSVLFYNTQKLAWLSTYTLVANVSDFNLYKLYYKDPNLAITHDTTYLYVIVNHTQSGSASATRDIQEAAEMAALRKRFKNLPNLINMGDFNLHSSTEAGYQSIISKSDTLTQMFDAAFYSDKTLSYPAQWDNNPAPFSAYLTTSTRALASVPNSCGTDGGAKSWYDHIFISPWLAAGSNYLSYIPGSYSTIGNDGHRLSVDINSNTPQPNTSAPTAVINALWQFSNKYPVAISLQVKANRSGSSLADPKENAN